MCIRDRLGTAGTAAHMFHDSGGAVNILVTKDFCPVSDIDILQICEMIFVKIADFLKNASAVHGSPGTGGKNGLRSLVQGDRTAVSPADALSLIHI